MGDFGEQKDGAVARGSGVERDFLKRLEERAVAAGDQAAGVLHGEVFQTCVRPRDGGRVFARARARGRGPRRRGGRGGRSAEEGFIRLLAGVTDHLLIRKTQSVRDCLRAALRIFGRVHFREVAVRAEEDERRQRRRIFRVRFQATDAGASGRSGENEEADTVALGEGAQHLHRGSQFGKI